MSINPRLSIKTIVRDDEDTLSLSGAMAIAPYSYDKAGNNQNNSAVYNLLNNQLQQSALYTITYDVMGNIKTKYNKLTKTTSKYTFNARNQLTQYTQEDENNQTTKTLSYTYDAFGRRVSKTEDTVTQKYLYDGDDIVAILDNDNNVIATITHDESIDTPLSITNDNGTFYYHRDHQGSIIALTDSTGTVVESFTYDNHYGTIVNHTKDIETNNPYAYTGRELDAPELYYYRARYYDATLQRFLSEDPIGFSSGDFNFYRYVWNSSVNFNDPYGRTPLHIAIAIAIGIAKVYKKSGIDIDIDFHGPHHFDGYETITDDCGRTKKVKCWRRHIQIKATRKGKYLWRQQIFYGSCYKKKSNSGAGGTY